MDFTFEELTMNAWPSIQTMVFDGWILRMANGYTKRANSIIPLYTFDNDIHGKIKYSEGIFRKNNLPVIFKIIGCNEHNEIDQTLEKMGYEHIDLTSVQICNKIINAENGYNGIFIDKEFSNEWINCFYDCNEIIDLNIQGTIKAILDNIKNDLITVYKKENNKFIGCGYGAIEKGYIGLFDIIVKNEFRGNGYGTKIVQTILSKANEQGIEKAYLSVVDNNVVAKKLYKKLGFNEIYKYWYRKKV